MDDSRKRSTVDRIGHPAFYRNILRESLEIEDRRQIGLKNPFHLFHTEQSIEGRGRNKRTYRPFVGTKQFSGIDHHRTRIFTECFDRKSPDDRFQIVPFHRYCNRFVFITYRSTDHIMEIDFFLIAAPFHQHRILRHLSGHHILIVADLRHPTGEQHRFSHQLHRYFHIECTFHHM